MREGQIYFVFLFYFTTEVMNILRKEVLSLPVRVCVSGEGCLCDLAGFSCSSLLVVDNALQRPVVLANLTVSLTAVNFSSLVKALIAWLFITVVE